MASASDEWPALSKSQVRKALRLFREQSGLATPRKTLAQARSEGFSAGVKAALKQIAKLAQEKETFTNE